MEQLRQQNAQEINLKGILGAVKTRKRKEEKIISY